MLASFRRIRRRELAGNDRVALPAHRQAGRGILGTARPSESGTEIRWRDLGSGAERRSMSPGGSANPRWPRCAAAVELGKRTIVGTRLRPGARATESSLDPIRQVNSVRGYAGLPGPYDLIATPQRRHRTGARRRHSGSAASVQAGSTSWTGSPARFSACSVALRRSRQDLICTIYPHFSVAANNGDNVERNSTNSMSITVQRPWVRDDENEWPDAAQWIREQCERLHEIVDNH